MTVDASEPTDHGNQHSHDYSNSARKFLDHHTPPSSLPDRMYLLNPGEGLKLAVDLPGYRVLAGEDQTEGYFTLIETIVDRDIPPHIHFEEDESFYLLEGQLKMFFGEKIYDVGPGSFMLLPRGQPHAVVRASKEPVKLLALSSPGGFEHLPENLALGSALKGEPLIFGGKEFSDIATKYGWVITPEAFPNYADVLNAIAEELSNRS